MTAPIERYLHDERLDRLIVAILNDRADETAAAVLPAEMISERIRQRAGVRTQQTLRAVAGLVVAAVVVLAAAAAALVGMRPPSPSPGPPTDASPSLAALETLNPNLAQQPILVDLLPGACFFNIHIPVRQALNTLVVTESGTPPGAPRGGVCQLWSSRAREGDDYLGNIHVFKPPTEERIPFRVRTLVGADATVVRGFSATPIYLTTCALLECNNAVLVVHERYMVLVFLQDRALDPATAMQTLEQIGVGIVALLNEEG
jgi:hypothetical protein